jgi:cytochrome c biogenesis protein CcdA/glutaredoxin
MGAMRNRIFATAALLLAGVVWAPAPGASAQAGAAEPVPIYVFSGATCPHCIAQKPFLRELEARDARVRVREFEVWHDRANRETFRRMAGAAGFEAGGVPATFIGGRVWVGYNEALRGEMEAAVLACLTAPCPDPGAGIVAGAASTAAAPVAFSGDTPCDGGGGEGGAGASACDDPLPTDAEVEAPVAAGSVIHLPVIGSVSLGARSLTFSTAVIAFVDGFNPCSLWVLSILLALVLHTGSRRKVFAVGGVFLLVTASVYGLFIAGLFKVFTVVDFLGPVQIVVALFALTFALVNIKDYFWYGKGFSFSISEKHKPKIYRDIRGLLTPGKSLPALLGATVVMALGIALIELPCTAGFPVLWSNLLAAQGVQGAEFAGLLALYMGIYLLDELLVFGVAVFTLRMSRMEEKHGRALKLTGGMVMLSLALVLLFAPERMNTFGGSMSVFALAFAATAAILLVNRNWRPDEATGNR